MKICRDCKLEKEDDVFIKNTNWCVNCKKIYMKLYVKNNKKLLQNKKRLYNIKNKEDIKIYEKQYRIKNKDFIKNKKKLYREKNKEKIIIYEKAYKNAYMSEKYLKNLIFKLHVRLSKSIYKTLKANGSSKNGKSILNFLSYSMQELKAHIESQFTGWDSWMNWGNWEKYRYNTWNDDDCSTWVWNLDHIIPKSDLPYSSMEDENFKKCWSLDNLRPYSAKDNVIDGATKIRHQQNIIK